jgi:DNA helicase HerA-like ATPase
MYKNWYITTSANAAVYVDPDKLYGRHLAVLGNTGSGKSCSVAGLIRWSLICKK